MRAIRLPAMIRAMIRAPAPASAPAPVPASRAPVFALVFALALTAAALMAGGSARAAGAATGGGFQTEAPVPEVDAALAAELFGVAGPVRVIREAGDVPGWSADTAEGPLGHIASTWEIARSLGYSGRPIDVLVAVTPEGRIAGARLIRHNEPILTLGISTADIARYVNGFAGVDLTRARPVDLEARDDLPDVIARATVSTGVIRDAILRTARALALARGAGGGARVDRARFEPMSWEALVGAGALASVTVTLDQAAAALAGAKPPPPTGDGAFIELWAALLDPPSIGRNLLGQFDYTRALAGLAPGDSALLAASRGLQSHRGLNWRRTGVFDRIRVRQGDEVFVLRKEDYQRIPRLRAAGAPDFKEISLFRLPGDRFDPARPFTVEVTATRRTAGDPVSMTVALDYALPARFLLAASALPEAAPLWVSAWQRKRVEIVGVAAMLATLAAMLFFQESFVRRPKLWRGVRIGYLSVTLVWLGWIAGAQLSVVQVVAFLQSLLSGFHWETFLIEPLVFMLWSFVGLGLLFWGRGVYCGWLCPFGALQEITNQIARRFRLPQIEIPFVVQERLWALKYTLFVAILALSFYSMDLALKVAEVEPFKTAISLRFMRAWPFLLFVAAVLGAGLFIERFYCRYLCPLGAALAIPAKLKLFDWLNRRPQCGRECRLCERECTVGAIDPLGRINPNECILCLRCQTIYHDETACTVLKNRLARARRAPPAARPPAKNAAPPPAPPAAPAGGAK